MNLRIIVTSLLGLALIALAVIGYKNISERKKHNRPTIPKERASVFIQTVKNEVKPLTISSNGTLVAKDRIEIFSEVQGIFEKSQRPFKPGVYFKKGELLLQINSEEHRANLQVQKSNLYQKLISVLPDLKFDYPNQFEKWNNYITNFDVNQSTQALPAFETNQEKLFISGKGIQSAYFVVKNLQERLTKYNIYAPYNGVLTTVNVTPGTLIRPGQRLGTFINTSVYELEVAINNTYSHFMKVGKKVQLNALDHSHSWNGKITRINSLIDQRTQSNTVFIQVSGKGLKEGMYLEAMIAAEEGTPAFEINRSLLNDGNKVFIVQQDSILKSVKVEPILFNEKTVFVKGLADGSQFVYRQVPGAFDGKIVKVLLEN